MKVGDTIWHFNSDRRVYREPTSAERAAGKIYVSSQLHRPKWSPTTICGETSRSWIAGDIRHPHMQDKVPKTGPHHGWAFTQKEVDDNCWIHDNGYFLGQLVGCHRDADVLRKIAAMVGYKDREPT